MNLQERLKKAGARDRQERYTFRPAPEAEPSEPNTYQELKSRIHSQLVERLDLSMLETIDKDRLQAEIRRIVENILSTETTPITSLERENLIVEVQYETLGLGPLEPLLQDPTVSDILVNSYDQVYVERYGRIEPTSVVFKSNEHLMQIIERIVARVGRRIDEASPMVDARLPDGSRVNAIIPPVSLDGPTLSIRRFAIDPYKMKDLVAFRTLTPAMGEVLEGVVKGRLNIVVSGGTGSGKTTLLNVLSGFIPSSERIITIEDAAELQLQQEHVIRLETRPPNIEGKGEITARGLVRNALRMRPDRIIIGETRGGEALDMLQAMNTGHEGSVCTLHANSARDALARLETMVLMASEVDMPQRVAREQICAALDLIIQIARLSDGARKIVNVSEVLGMEGPVITMQDIFVFRQTGVDATGKVLGDHVPTGIRPTFLDRLGVRGVDLPEALFQP